MEVLARLLLWGSVTLSLLTWVEVPLFAGRTGWLALALLAGAMLCNKRQGG